MIGSTRLLTGVILISILGVGCVSPLSEEKTSPFAEFQSCPSEHVEKCADGAMHVELLDGPPANAVCVDHAGGGGLGVAVRLMWSPDGLGFDLEVNLDLESRAVGGVIEFETPSLTALTWNGALSGYVPTDMKAGEEHRLDFRIYEVRHESTYPDLHNGTLTTIWNESGSHATHLIAGQERYWFPGMLQGRVPMESYSLASEDHLITFEVVIVPLHFEGFGLPQVATLC